MQRLLMLFGFAVLILGAGLLAGQRVQSSQASDTAPTNPADKNGVCENLQTACATPARHLVDESSFEAEILRVPQADSRILPVNHQRTLEEDFELAGFSEDVDSTDVQKTDVQKGERIRSLICRSFPDASEETVNVWAEVYAAMDPAEVEFILEQKRAVSGTLDSHIPGIMISPGLSSPSPPAEGHDSSRNNSPALSSAIAMIQQNLNNAWSVGFRRTVVLPHARLGSEAGSEVATASASPTVFTDFETGRLISSPMPLHVAIRDNPAWMFRLEGEKLTRRGDFQLLPDRRIGLMISGTVCAVTNSPIIPADARRPAITATGRIEYRDLSDAIISAGQLEIVRVTELDQLDSTDGIHFASRTSGTLETVTAEEANLVICTLELSNVDREEETALLNHLRAKRDGN